MTDTNKCPNCDFELEDEHDCGCPMCHAIERNLNSFAENRWNQNYQSWEDFWRECEQIKGKL